MSDRTDCLKPIRLPDKALFLALLAGWIAVFHFVGNATFGYVNTPSIFGWWLGVTVHDMANCAFWEVPGKILGSEEPQLWLVPLVMAGLFWWKRRELELVPKAIWWPALGLLAAALTLHVLGYMVQQPKISLVSFFVGLYALSGLVWGRAWLRAIFFPSFLFVFCIPLGNTAEYVTFALRLAATKITVMLASGVLGIDVVQTGTSIWEPSGRFQYEVAAACSGIRSLTAISALAVVYAFLDPRRNWERLVLIAAAVPLSVAGNVVRLLTIILVAETFGQSAGNYVHESAWFSLLPYIPAFGGLMLLGHWLGRPARASAGALNAKTA
jgi:exosortase